MRNAIGAGTSISRARGGRAHEQRDAPPSAATSGTQPSPQVNDHR